ncbi:MAG: sugar phosphate isomerase/epimerase [Armatimonadetes bacterium]|nr:sugar phosphate isomerase/epimerase [Armatimonadota bacterium]
MKPCLFPVGFRPHGDKFIEMQLEELVPRAAAVGFEGMDLLSDHVDDYLERDGHDLTSLKALFQAHAVAVPQVNAYRIEIFDAGAREAIWRNFRRCLDCAAALGSTSVGAFIGLPRGIGKPERLSPADWKDGTQQVAAMVAECAAKGVVLAVGPHDGTLTDTIESIQRLKREVGAASLKVFLDYGNLCLVGDDPIEAVDRLAQDTVLVRAFAYRAQEKRLVRLGEGDWDDRAVLARLREKGYDGPVSLKYAVTDGIWDILAHGATFIKSV